MTGASDYPEAFLWFFRADTESVTLNRCLPLSSLSFSVYRYELPYYPFRRKRKSLLCSREILEKHWNKVPFKLAVLFCFRQSQLPKELIIAWNIVDLSDSKHQQLYLPANGKVLCLRGTLSKQTSWHFNCDHMGLTHSSPLAPTTKNLLQQALFSLQFNLLRLFQQVVHVTKTQLRLFPLPQ